MTMARLRELASDLTAAGAISIQDHRLLSLDSATCSPRWPGWSRFETAADAAGRRDWIDEVERRLRRGYPEFAYITYLRTLLAILKRVEAARQEVFGPAATRPPEIFTSPNPQPVST